MLITSFILAIYFLKQKSAKQKDNLSTARQKLREDELFNLSPALKFAFLFIVIKLLSQVAFKLFGSGGFLVSIGFGAIPGIDAVLISIAELSGKTLTIQTALWAFIFANTVNLLTICIYSFLQGKREFAVKFSFSAFLILVSGILGLLFSIR